MTSIPLTSAQLRVARGADHAPISTYLDEVWLDEVWHDTSAMAAADDVVTQHEEGALSDAEFDDQLSAIIATERQAEIVTPEIIEPVEGTLVLTDELLDRACEIETAALREETGTPISSLMADIEAADWSLAPWGHAMGYSAAEIDRKAVASAHRQAELEELDRLWRIQAFYDDLDAMDLTGVEIEPLVDLSDVEQMMAVAS